MIAFKHESSHLWESKVRTAMLKFDDLIILSNFGVRLVNLGSKRKKILKIQDKKDCLLHPISSCNDLCLENSNHIMLSYTNTNEIIISIQEQYKDMFGETYFENIYKLKIHQIKLVELMLLQSIYMCRQLYDIVKLIEMQKDVSNFINPYLELGRKNMVHILSFDSKSISSIFSDKHKDLFARKEFPVIYQGSTNLCFGGATEDHEDLYIKKKGHNCRRKNMVKTFCELSEQIVKQSAIDVALENNQIIGVKMLIDHVILNQNSFIYSFLFKHNLVLMMEKGIEI